MIALQIYLFGGVVTSWTQPSGDEVLFVRPDAKFDKSKPISGGIPHCFPQVDALLSAFRPLPAMLPRFTILLLSAPDSARTFGPSSMCWLY